MVVKILRAAVVDKHPQVIRWSHSQPDPIEKNHITMYGNAVRNPFCETDLFMLSVSFLKESLKDIPLI
jgi:hypothetical protein